MTNNELAKLLIEDFGGSGNLKEVINCMTRVRVKVNNPDLIDYEKLNQGRESLALLKESKSK